MTNRNFCAYIMMDKKLLTFRFIFTIMDAQEKIMAIPFHKAVSSIDSICSSIENDHHVYRWFIKFISHPEIKKRLEKSLSDQQAYKAVRNLELFKSAAFFFLMAIFVTAFLAKQNLLLILGIPVLYGIHRLTELHKKKIAEISRSILNLDRDAIKLEAQTLYQICEHYGQMLKIPTLVDVIAHQDDILRHTVIYACVITCFIYPLDFLNNWAIVFGSFFIVQLAINTPLVFDHLK